MTSSRIKQLADKILDAASSDTEQNQRDLDGWVALAIDDNLLEQVVKLLEEDVSEEILGVIHMASIKHMEHRVIRVKNKPMSSRLLVIPLLLTQNFDPMDEGSANKNSTIPFPSAIAETIRLSGLFQADARVCVLGSLLNHNTVTDISIHEWTYMHKTLAEMQEGQTRIGISLQTENSAYMLYNRMLFLRYVVVAISCPVAREKDVFTSQTDFSMESLLTQIAQNLSLQFTEFGNSVDVSCITPNSPLVAMATAETVLACKVTESLAIGASYEGSHLIAAEAEKIEDNTLTVKMHLQSESQFGTDEISFTLPIAANASESIMQSILKNIPSRRPGISVH